MAITFGLIFGRLKTNDCRNPRQSDPVHHRRHPLLPARRRHVGLRRVRVVLWNELLVLTKSSNTTETAWQIAAAVRSHEACQSLMRRQIEARTAKLRETGDARAEGDTVIASGSDLTTIRRYICLPDTVDPRGPKGN